MDVVYSYTDTYIFKFNGYAYRLFVFVEALGLAWILRLDQSGQLMQRNCYVAHVQRRRYAWTDRSAGLASHQAATIGSNGNRFGCWRRCRRRAHQERRIDDATDTIIIIIVIGAGSAQQRIEAAVRMIGRNGRHRCGMMLQHGMMILLSIERHHRLAAGIVK